MAILQESLGSLGAPRANNAVATSVATRYIEMLFDKVASQEDPNPDLLARIEQSMEANYGLGDVRALKARYVGILIDKAGSQEEPTPDLLDRVEKLLASGALDEKPASVPGAGPTRRRKIPRRRRSTAGAGHPEVAPDEFKGMGPTDGYRKFIATYGDKYTVPQIRDALVMGGVSSATRTSLLTGLHSVRRRDRLKAEAEQEKAKELEAKKASARAAAERRAAEMESKGTGTLTRRITPEGSGE